MSTSMSLKTRTAALLFFIVLLATIPLTIYYTVAFRELAGLGNDPTIESALQDALDRSTTASIQAQYDKSLKKYRQITVIRKTITHQVLVVSIVYGCFVIIVAWGIGYLFIVRITRPLKELTEATSRLAADKTTELLPENGVGEIGILIQAFNTMTKNLDTARQATLLAERKATWQRVARVIAHEIKNPLTPIRLSTERMYEKFLKQSPDFGTVIKSTVDTVLTEIGTLQRLVDTFHKYARFPDPNPMLESPAEIVQGVCALFADAAAKVVYECAPDVPKMQLDKGQIREALMNLIKNGVEATVECGRTGLVRVEVVSVDNRIRISVADNGSGVSAENKERLFQPYFTTKKNGNGIGLALTERIISLHGGTIRCESELGKGTSFFVEFPKV